MFALNLYHSTSKRETRIRTAVPLFFGLFLIIHSPVFGEGAGSSAGISLLQPPGARSAALGEAFTSVNDDVTAMSFNPASLATLKNRSASYLYQRGIADDYFSQLMIGMPREKDAWGLSIAYFNGGKMDLYDGSNT